MISSLVPRSTVKLEQVRESADHQAIDRNLLKYREQSSEGVRQLHGLGSEH